MATFKFSSASELNTFIAACAASFIEGGKAIDPSNGMAALTQSWGGPSYYGLAGDRSIELPWTISTHGEHRRVYYYNEDDGVNPEYDSRVVRKFEVSFKSSMGTGTALLIVDEGAMAPDIAMVTFSPSEHFLRLAAGMDKAENRWWYTTRAMELLGWIRPATEAEENHHAVYNSGGTMYMALSIQDKALNALRDRARPEPTEFMKLRGLVYKRAA